MIRASHWGILALALGILIARPAAADAPLAPQYVKVFEEFTGQKADPARVAQVSGLGLLRDAGILDLTQGTLALCTPVSGRVCGALYSGTGEFSMTPPTGVERAQLKRFLGSQTLHLPIRAVVFLFDDSTAAYLESQLHFAAGAPPASAADLLSGCLTDLADAGSKDLDYSFARSLLEDHRSGLFYAAVFPDKGDPVFLKIDPFNYEPVQLFRRTRVSVLPGHRRELELVCQFYAGGEPDTAAGMDVRPSCAVPRHHIECSIAPSARFSAHSEMDVVPASTGDHWLALDLCPLLNVDSASWDAGESAPFAWGGREGSLWVYSKDVLSGSHPRKLTVHYHGDLLTESPFGWYTVCEGDWFPRPPGNEPALFDITYHLSDRFQLASVGEKVSEVRDGRVVTSHWVTSRPIAFCGFNIGLFQQTETSAAGLPVVIVQMSRIGHRELGAALDEDADVPTGKAMDKQVAADVMNSLSLFQHAFGPVDLKRLYVTETPELHGLGFPGMIHLDLLTFQTEALNGFDQLFRAHEVAHQWWGNGVRARTYHDLWIQEGFSEYCGAWFMQATLHDNKKYFKMLDDYRHEILENRKFLLGKGQEAGPVWLGSRAETRTTGGDYSLVIYKKGAWVLHMLRNMMLDLRTMDDSAFTETLHDFYQSYTGHAATTEDFRRVAEKHMGEDLGWFFREWLYGTDIPRYTFAWTAGAPADGKVKVSCRVEQAGVPDDFEMIVPVRVEFKGDRYALWRVRIVGPHSEFDLPPMPEVPERVVFNPLSSVLCEQETVAWK